MSARASMTMRAEVTRDTSGKNDWGTKAAQTLVDLGLVPCRAWSTGRRFVTDSGRSGVIEDMRAMVPLSANVEESDRLVIKDRLGVLQFDGPVFVESKIRVSGSGSRANHFELMLTRHLS